MVRKIKLALLLCDTPIPSVLAEHGNYTSIFTNLLRDSLPKDSGYDFQLDPYDVRGKIEYPEKSLFDGEDGYKAVIMTGSAASAYEDVPWINKLVDWVAWLAKSKPDTKIVGICFGHQIVARALGGSCVPNDGRWEIGPCEVEMTDLGKQIFGLDVLNIQQMHRDHVPSVPPSFHLLGSTPVSPVQGLVRFISSSPTDSAITSIDPPASDIPPSERTLKDVHILTLQGHPEFTAPIVKKIIDAREEAGILKGDVVKVAREKEEQGWRNDGVGVVGKAVWGVVMEYVSRIIKSIYYFPSSGCQLSCALVLTSLRRESANDTSTLDKEEGNILMSLISQLRPGMDLSKIALPTFVLEPRSLLERITDFFSHPELIFGAGDEEDAQERFMMVMTFYLSGWHIKPKGVKKPYNPVLGEFFRCAYYYADGSQGFYVAEQVSHHPPVSAFFYISPKNGLLVTGELKPKSRFLGNSAATIMEGEDRIRLLNRPEDGEYVITMPNTYARGILFGKMTLELCDLSSIANPQTGYQCDVDFKAKGWISGGYNSIAGHVRGPNRIDVGEITGHWSSKMEFLEKKSGTRDILFDPARASVVPKSVLPESEQEENESRRLWTKLTAAIKNADMHGATAAKSEVEDRQRESARKREATGEVPEARFFQHISGDKWMPKLDIDNLPKDPLEMEEQVKKWIFGDKVPEPGGISHRASISTQNSAPATPAKFTASGDTAGSAPPPTDGPLAPPTVPTAPGPPAPGPKSRQPL